MSPHRTRNARWAVGAASVAALAAGRGCGTETVPIANIPLPEAGYPCVLPGPDGGAAASGVDAAAACGRGEFCEPSSCGSSIGTCKLPQSSCTDPADFVCGCDGVTYFNDCVRQSAGVGLSSQPGVCGVGYRACGGEVPGNTCPGSDAGQSVCALIVPPSAFTAILEKTLCTFPPTTPGLTQCVVLPPTPPLEDGGEAKLQRLEPSTSLPCPAPGPCLDAYQALQSSEDDIFVVTPASQCPQ